MTTFTRTKQIRKGEFGRLLRQHRKLAGKTLGQVARKLGVSVVYVSDVERGNRAPFVTPRIVSAARFFHAGTENLLQAAAKERGFFEFDVSAASPKAMQALSGLARRDVTDDQWDEIVRILNEHKSGGE